MMKAKKAIEIIADQTNGNPGEITEAVTYLMQCEADVKHLQERCSAMTEGMLCMYCAMYERCNERGKK